MLLLVLHVIEGKLRAHQSYHNHHRDVSNSWMSLKTSNANLLLVLEEVSGDHQYH